MYKDLIRLLLIFKLALALVIGILLYMAFPGCFSKINFTELPSFPTGPSTKEEAQVTLTNYLEESAGVLVANTHVELVKKHCTGCHSARLIAQNRKSKDRWKENIVWMQATQGLWDLGEDEAGILEYLSTNYAPENSGRRKALNLNDKDWYYLNE